MHSAYITLFVWHTFYLYCIYSFPLVFTNFCSKLLPLHHRNGDSLAIQHFLIRAFIFAVFITIPGTLGLRAARHCIPAAFSSEDFHKTRLSLYLQRQRQLGTCMKCRGFLLECNGIKRTSAQILLNCHPVSRETRCKEHGEMSK